MDESPRPWMPLGVECSVVLRVVVLGNSRGELARLANVDLAERIDQYVDREVVGRNIKLSARARTVESVSRRINSRMLYH